MRRLQRNTETFKMIAKDLLKPGDLAIDATMGDGNDTKFLAGLGCEVLSFDIQEEALEKTKNLLGDDFKNVKLILDSHENIEKYLEGRKIKLATFNTGYLPDGDHSITTKGESTIKALDTCIKNLDKDGVISLIIYQGHDNGEEKKQIEKYLTENNEIEIIKIEKMKNLKAPISYFISRK